MVIDLFTLCDGAYNYNGKLTIVGTIDTMFVPEVPAKVQFSIAMKLRFDTTESGKHSMMVRIKDVDGKNIPPDMKLDLDIQPSEADTIVSLAVNAQGLPFDKFGKYQVEVLVDDVLKGDYAFKLQKK